MLRIGIDVSQIEVIRFRHFLGRRLDVDVE